MLARGEKKLGFCHCASCNRGYRELQAWIINGTEKKNLTAQSREIVIKSSYDKIEGMTYDISDFLRSLKEPGDKKLTSNNNDPKSNSTHNGKIVIEIDSNMLENAVIQVLSSEKGRQIIQSIPSKYTKKKVNSGKDTNV